MLNLLASPPTIGPDVHPGGVLLAEAVRVHTRFRLYGLYDSASLHLVDLLESPCDGATKDLWDLFLRKRYVPVVVVEHGRHQNTVGSTTTAPRVGSGWACL